MVDFELPLGRRSPQSPSPSGELLAAALSGLLGIAGCSSGPANPDEGSRPDGSSGASSCSGLDASADTAAPDALAGDSAQTSQEASADTGAPLDAQTADAPYNIEIETDASFTLDQFEALCDSRGGVVYVNAACAGGAACKGLSFHSGTLWDHSCRGQNSTCAGINCVDTPADTGLTGKEVYEQGPCGGCHGLFDADSGSVDFSWYGIYYYTEDPAQLTYQFDPSTASDYKAALDLYKTYSVRAIQSKIAFGVSGVYPDGTPYNNMPMYYQKYSAAEMKRVAEYLQITATTGLKPYGYGYPEYTYVNLPDASAPPDAGFADAAGD